MKRKFTFVHLRGDSGLKFSTEKNRRTNVRNKWIKKENWFQKHFNLKLSKSTFRMQFAPSLQMEDGNALTKLQFCLFLHSDIKMALQ